MAFAALKYATRRSATHWEPREEKGPSDERAAVGGLDSDRPTARGVDANASKQHLLEVAKRLDVPGRSSMTKDELVDAIGKANDRETAKARDEKK